MGRLTNRTECCCFSARTGAKTLAILGVIICVIMIAYSSVLLVKGAEPICWKGNCVTPNHGPDGILVALIVRGILVGICCMLMLHGVNRNRANFMSPYIIIQAIQIVAYAGLSVFHICVKIRAKIETPEYENGGLLLAYCAGVIFLLSNLIYFWSVVVSVYKAIKEENYARLTNQSESACA